MSSPKLLAVCSGGGHLIELLRLTPAFDDHTVVLVSTSPEAPDGISLARYYRVSDSNAGQLLCVLRTALQTAHIVFRERPTAVISTGAAPGLLAIAWARLLRRKLIWIDSIANPERMSLSGRIARRITPHCFTQWRHLSSAEGIAYIGCSLPTQPEAAL
ncbi:hypothetical protein [Haliea sp. E17]|uniref:hypothetical protein n=1 Tax=Haliea sp. E17 TaxID=3401576 RepID=UPI003AAC82C4